MVCRYFIGRSLSASCIRQASGSCQVWNRTRRWWIMRAGNMAQPRAYTPNHLVEKILNSRSALEGERKQVTVLFVDVKESMHLAERVDLEEWHRIMDQF